MVFGVIGKQFDQKKGGGFADLAGMVPAQTVDAAVDASFQRPGELPFVSSEDDIDLLGGSPSNPTGDPNFQGEDRRSFLEQITDALGISTTELIAGLAAVYVLGQLFDVNLGSGGVSA